MSFIDLLTGLGTLLGWTILLLLQYIRNSRAPLLPAGPGLPGGEIVTRLEGQISEQLGRIQKLENQVQVLTVNNQRLTDANTKLNADNAALEEKHRLEKADSDGKLVELFGKVDSLEKKTAEQEVQLKETQRERDEAEIARKAGLEALRIVVEAAMKNRPIPGFVEAAEQAAEQAGEGLPPIPEQSTQAEGHHA